MEVILDRHESPISQGGDGLLGCVASCRNGVEGAHHRAQLGVLESGLEFETGPHQVPHPGQNETRVCTLRHLTHQDRRVDPGAGGRNRTARSDIDFLELGEALGDAVRSQGREVVEGGIARTICKWHYRDAVRVEGFGDLHRWLVTRSLGQRPP